MFLTKKTCSIFAVLFFGVQVFLACSDSNSESSSVVQAPAEHQTSPEENSKEGSVVADSSVADDSSKVERSGLRTYILGDSAGRLISSDLYLDYPADSFLTEFDYGDIVIVAIAGYDTLEMPVVESAYDVPIAGFALMANRGSENIILSIHYGQMDDILGITDVVTPIEVDISMKDKGGFLFGLEMRSVQYMGTNKGNYPSLSIDEFANFREVRTTGMGKNKLYRSSNPVDPCLGRNLVADSLAKEAGVATFINLADSEIDAKSFKGFDSSYYASQNASFLAMPVEFFSKTFKDKLANGFRYMIEHEGPYLVHCTYGMDRTGWTIAVLEALMGATVEEIQADYAKTFSNYYYVVDGLQVALNERQVDFFKSVVLRNLRAVYHAEGIETADEVKVDWSVATEKYLEKLGLSPEEISSLKDRLK